MCEPCSPSSMCIYVSPLLHLRSKSGSFFKVRRTAVDQQPRLLSYNHNPGGILDMAQGNRTMAAHKRKQMNSRTHAGPFFLPISLCPLPHSFLGTTSHALVSGCALKPNELRRKLIVVGTYETQDQIGKANMSQTVNNPWKSFRESSDFTAWEATMVEPSRERSRWDFR